jgi:DNA-binding MarR family transcriptional regulator
MESSAPAAVANLDAAEALLGLTLFVLRESSGLRDISLSAAATLSTLEFFGPSRISHLAEREHTAQPSMTALIRRLERRGLVERRQDLRDGRAVQVSITEAGRLKLRSHRAAQVALISELVRQIEPTEREQLALVARAIGRLLNGAVTEMAAGEVRGQLSAGT